MAVLLLPSFWPSTAVGLVEQRVRRKLEAESVTRLKIELGALDARIFVRLRESGADV